MSTYLVALKVSEPSVAFAITVARSEGVVGTVWDGDPDWHLFEVEYPAWKRARAASNSVALAFPSSNRTMRRIPQGVKDWLTARGVTFEPGDTVADMIAQLTNSEDFE